MNLGTDEYIADSNNPKMSTIIKTTFQKENIINVNKKLLS